MDSFEISASALTAQRLRLDIIAGNLANVNSTRKADGSLGAYRRRNAVFAPILQQQMSDGGNNLASSVPLTSSNDVDSGSTGGMSMENGTPTLKASIGKTRYEGMGVHVTQIVEDTQTPMKVVYDPSHPDADEKGYVELPNINPVTEMVDMIAATRSYEANVTALQASKSFGKAALEI